MNHSILARIFIALIISVSNLNAQSLKTLLTKDSFNHFYSLTEDQLSHIFNKGKIDDTAWYLKNPYKKIGILSPNYKDSIDYGSYIIATINENQISYELYQKIPFKIVFKKIENELILFLKSELDSNYQELISQAEISYLGNKLNYDSSYGGYVFPLNYLYNLKRKHYLSITWNGNYFLKPFDYIPEIKSKKNYSSNNFTGKAYGYCITDKPIYKLGDSLHFKGFLINNETEQALNKDVYFKIYDPRQGRNILFTKLKPISPGAFIFDWLIPDSLRQDVNYTIIIGYGDSKSRFVSREHSFRVESYILDKSNISFKATKNNFKAGETLELKANTTDANGFPIGDVRLQYIVKINQIHQIYQDTILVSQNRMDSFIVMDSTLPYEKTHSFYIDYKSLPNADVSMTILGSITDPQFEKQDFSFNIDYSTQKDQLLFMQSEDSVIIRSLHLTRDTQMRYLLKSYKAGLEIKDSLWIKTPYRAKLSYGIEKMALFDSSKFIQNINIVFNTLQMLRVQGRRNPRDIEISFKYPFEKPVYYRVTRKNQLVIRGFNHNLKFIANDSSLDEYAILLGHNHNGDIEDNFYKFNFYPLDKKVNIETTVPIKAFPGQSIPIDFKVTDWYGRPIENFNLSSFALNNQFKDKISEPYIDIPAQYKLAMKSDAIKGTFQNINEKNFLIQNSYYLTKRHISTFNIHKNEFYGLLYPPKGFNVIKTNKQHSLPEISVSISYKGKLFTPKYFLIDNQYKAVSGINPSSRYSFVLKEGLHSLTIRSFDKVIYIPKIEFKTYTKHHIAISIDSIDVLREEKLAIITDSMPLFKTTPSEQASIEKSLLILKDFYVDSISTIQNSLYSAIQFKTKYNQYESIKIDQDYFNVIGPLDFNHVVLLNRTREYTLQTGRYIHYYQYTNGQFVSKEIDKKNLLQLNLVDIPLTNYYDLLYLIEKDTPITQITQNINKIISNNNQITKDYFKSENIAYNDYKQSTNTFQLRFFNLKNRIKSCWIVNKKERYNSQYINHIYHNQTILSHNANSSVDIYFITGDNHLRVFKNKFIPPNHILYMNSDLLQFDSLYEETISEAISLYNKLTEKPKLPFYYHPEESHKLNIETNSYLNQPDKAIVQGTVINGQINALEGVHIILEQNGLYKYGAISNEKGEFEFLNIPEGIYDIKLYAPTYQLKYYYKVFLGGHHQQMITCVMKRKEVQMPRYESVTNNYQLTIFEGYKNSRLDIQIFNRDSRELLKNALVKIFINQKEVYIENPNSKPIILENDADSFTIEVSHKGYKSLSFKLSGLEMASKIKLNVFLDLNSAITSTIDYYIMPVNLKSIPQEFDLSTVIKNLEPEKGAIAGKIIDENGEPIPFAHLIIVEDEAGLKLNSKGTKTDAQGFYALHGLSSGKYNLMCRQLGFEKVINPNIMVEKGKVSIANFELSRGKTAKKEVMIIASSKTKQPKLIDVFQPKENQISAAEVSMLASPREVNSIASSTGGMVQEDMGSSLNIGGGRSDAVAYFVDGVKMTGSASVPANSITQLEVITSGVPAKYGDLNQEIKIISTDKEIDDLLDQGYENKVRENFSDVGYWIPNLLTNKDGVAHSTIKLPDNITQWKSFTLGMSNYFRYGQISQNISVYKPLQTVTYTPNFLHSGDSIILKAKFTNLTEQPKKCTLFFDINKVRKLETSQIITNFKTDSISINISDIDTLEIQAGLNYENKFNDIEKLKIPILTNDIKFYNHRNFYADIDSTYNISFKENTKGFITFNNSIYENILTYIEDLNNYAYGCVEQTSSKLKALHYQQVIYTKLNKDIHIQKEINQMAQRLAAMQNSNGSFGWWKNGYEDIYMTTYALDALMTYSRGNYNSAASDAAKFLRRKIERTMTAEYLYSAWILLKYNLISPDYISLNSIEEIKLSTSQKMYLYKIKQYKGELISGSDYYGLLMELYNNQNLRQYENFFNDNKANIFNAYTLFKGTPFESELNSKFRDDLTRGSLSKELNTFSKASLIEALVIDNYSMNTINSDIIINEQIKVNQYPYRMKLDNINQLRIQHKGAPIWVNTSEEEWLSQPVLHDSIFRIETKYVQSSSPESNYLTRGVPTKLIVDIYAFQSKDYIMIEIPLPAGVIIKNKTSLYGGDYIEYRYDKIIVFKHKLNIGSHQLSFDIQPIFTGRFNIPPASISMMYYPFVYGNNLKSEIWIK